MNSKICHLELMVPFYQVGSTVMKIDIFIRFIISNNEIITNVVNCGIEKGKLDALWDTFCLFCNPTMHQICDILLFALSLYAKK